MPDSFFSSRADLNDAVETFLDDIADVSGFGAARKGKFRPISAYVIRRPILTVPDPWFFAGLVALECTKICDVFSPKEAELLLRRVAGQMDSVVGRRGTALARLMFALMGRLGCGAILMHMKVPDQRISEIILLMMGNHKNWQHLLPDAAAHGQVRRALRNGTPSWWSDYAIRNAVKNRPGEDEFEPVSLATLLEVPDLLPDDVDGPEEMDGRETAPVL